EFGTSVQKVYRISRLYDRLTERSALVMIAAWRGSSMALARAKYRPALYDEERQRARSAPGERRPVVQPGSGPVVRTGTDTTARGSFPVIARSEATKQSRVTRATLDCFASLAMTNESLLRLGQIEKMPPCPVLGLDDPDIRIETNFLGEPLLDGLLRH